MIFNSFDFLIFFLVVAVAYYVLPHKFRWILLLCSSYYFYMCWRAELILLIVFSTFFNYVISWRIFRKKNQKDKLRLLTISLMVNFGLLFVFKYSMFFNQSIIEITQYLVGLYYQLTGASAQIAAQSASAFISRYPGREFDIILPMGISFYTFQAASYTIDVYRGDVKPVKHYGIFSLFITFFPQLVAGPIERSKNLLPQFFKRHKFKKENISAGCKLMLLGFFKKIVIADRTAIAVNTVFNNVQNYSGLSLVIVAVLFTFQIYCDFSGYSDIAMGSARVMGFDLMMNFQKPYLSKSIKEFWRRWHVSLSTWFADYVYIPLGGNRKGRLMQYRNMMITFVTSGLWHGANWTFLLWGALHGAYQVIGMLTKGIRDNIKAFIGIKNTFIESLSAVIITFSLVAFGLILFRANTIGDAYYVITHLFNDMGQWLNLQYLYDTITNLGVNVYELKIIAVAILFLITSEIISKDKPVFTYFEQSPAFIRIMYYVLVAAIILCWGVYYNAGEFIYFQF